MRMLIVAALLAGCAGSKHDVQVPADARAVHQKMIFIDTHSDITEAIFYEDYDFLARHDTRHLDLPRMQEGGLDALFFSVFIHPESVDIQQFFPEAMKEVEALQALARKSGGKLAMARTAAEIEANAQAGVTSMLIGVEGGHMLLPGNEDQQLEHLRALEKKGVRYLTLAWSSSSPIGGSTAEGEQEGLTPFGHKALKEMERLGIIADLSHGSDPLFWDVIKAAKKPILLTHSAARALSNHPRNASDEMLQAVAKNGGAVCVDFSRTFLDDKYRKASQSLLQKSKGMRNSEKVRLYQNAKLPDVPVTRLVDHIEHVAKVAGVDHTCLGSDFDGAPLMPNGLEDVSKLPAITAELQRRGWSNEDIAKVAGGNVLRVLADTEPR